MRNGGVGDALDEDPPARPPIAQYRSKSVSLNSDSLNSGAVTSGSVTSGWLPAADAEGVGSINAAWAWRYLRVLSPMLPGRT